MTYADGFILSMIGLSGLFAWIRGLSREGGTLLAIVAGALAVFLLRDMVSDMAGDKAINAMIGLVVVFLIGFVAASIGLEILLSSLLGKTPQMPDKIAGAVFGIIRGWLIVGLAYLASTYYFPEDNMPEPIENAVLKSVATSAASLLEHFGLEKENTNNESRDTTSAE